MTKKKISTSEVGHAKNIAHFEMMIETCEGFYSDYTPSNSMLQIVKLREKLDLCKDNMDAVQLTKVPLMHAVNERQLAFEGLRKLCTRVVNTLASVADNKQVIADAKTYNRKIQGKQSLPKIKEESVGQETERELSTSQQSYDKLIENFSFLIRFLEEEPAYASITDDEVKLTDLNTYLEELKAVNKAVMKPFVKYRDALNTRKVNMYDRVTGMLHVAATVKHYVKGRFGADSNQYKEISGLEFRRIV